MLTIDAFSRWSSYHNSCYAGFSKWMLEDTTNQRMEIWQTRLDGYSVDELKAASFDHYKLPMETKQGGFTSHLDGLERILRANRSAQQEPQNVTRYSRLCGLCGNHGLLSVVARPGFPAFTPLGCECKRPFGVACKCECGDKYRKGFNTFDATRYEPSDAYQAREFPVSQELQEIFKLPDWDAKRKSYDEYRRKRAVTLPSHSIGKVLSESAP